MKTLSQYALLLVFFLVLGHLGVSYAQTVTFNYTGSMQTWVVPPCVTNITVTVAGAEGGGTNGGNGAIVTGTIPVTPGQTLNIYVGGSGNCPGAGWNGGGSGQNANSTANRSCGGGGASDIRIGGTALGNRVVVASGGGGMGGGTQDAVGGNGGCGTGVAGVSPFGYGGGGATQSAGGSAGPPWISSGNYGTAGSLGMGGNGGTDPCYNNSPGGGGGGGYYGGGGGGSDCFDLTPYGGGSGGGGSSLTPGGGGCNAGTNNGPGYITISYTTTAVAVNPTNTGPYCVGQTIQLNAGSAGTTYAWTGPNGFSSASQNPTLPATSAASGTYTLTITNSGCTSSGSTTVVVNPAPAVNAGVDQTVCQGTQVTLTGSGATTYSWNNGVSQGAAFTPPVGSTTYTVTGTSSGCTATDQVVVTVNPTPVVNAGPDQTVCQGTQVTLTGSGTTTYSWNNGVSQGVAFTPPTGSTTYTVTGTMGGCSATDQVMVTVNPAPVVNAGADQTVCQGTQVTLTGSGATTYSWNNGVSQGVAFSPPTGTTTYTVTGTTSGCTGTDQVIVTVNPLPVVNAGPDQTVCQGLQVTLTATGATTYTWNNGVSQGVPFTPPVGSTTYTVTGTAAGCSATDQVVVTSNASLSVNAGVDQTVCQGTPVTLSASGAATYSWDNGVTQGTAFTPPVGSTTYTVTGTTSGCTGTDQVVVTVNPTPVVNAGPDQTVCPGTQVTLTGSGASSYSWNYGVSQGTAFTPPAGSTTYTVTGTTGGCSATDQVIVTVNPTPAVNAGLDQTVCQGTQVTLTGTGATTYTWNNGVSQGVAFTPPTGSTTYTVTGTSAGCSATDQVVVTVNPNPVMNAGVDQTVCQGTQVTLTASGATTYSWNNSVSQGVPFTAPVGTTSYIVTGTTLGCTGTDLVVVTVNSAPAVNAGPDQTICAGTQATLTASGANTYSWSPVASNQASVTVSPAGTTTYTVTGTSLGCTATDNVIVYVNQNPAVNAGPDVSICLGESTVLNASGASQYLWTPMNQPTASVQVSPNTTSMYTVVGVDSYGCTGTDNVTVTVNALPNVDAGLNQTICAGSGVVLNAVGQGSMVWSGGVVNGQSFVPNQDAWYFVTATDANNCVNVDSVEVTLEPSSPASFTTNTNMGCAPLLLTLTNTTPGTSTNCVWQVGNTTLSGCNGVSTTLTAPGYYDIELTTTSINGCDFTLFVPQAVYVAPIPTAAFTYSPAEISEMNPQVFFANQSQNATTYLWDFGSGSAGSSASNPIYTYPYQAGTYTVELIAISAYGCSDTTTKEIQVNEALIYYVPNSFTPDGDDYNPEFKPIFTSGYDPYDYQLLIFNRWGELLFESYDANFGWDGTYGGELVAQGTYTWRIAFKTSANDERKLVHGHVNLLK